MAASNAPTTSIKGMESWRQRVCKLKMDDRVEIERFCRQIMFEMG